jgi:glycerate-2-kinase
VDAARPASLLNAARIAGIVNLHTIREPIHLVAAGKAAWPMAHAFLAQRSDVVGGIVSGPRFGEVDLPATIEHIDGAHPLPDEASERAGRRALALAGASRRQGTLVVLLSGGASSMLAVPAAGITIGDKAAAVRALMNAGVPIDELNCVRKHLSAIKGGRLGRASGSVVTFAISDVHGPIEDDPSVIGSGPTVADPTTYAQALDVIDGSGARVPVAVRELLARGAAGELDETPKPHTDDLLQTGYVVLGGRRSAMDGVASAARSLGYNVSVVETPTSGEARDAGKLFAEAARLAAETADRPLCVVASGETTVHVSGGGLGGRNQEFALGALRIMDGRTAVLASAGTDGIDGPTDAAGAIVDGTSLQRARASNLSLSVALEQNASYEFFRSLGDLIVWGPTGTNVGDVHVMLIA